MIMNPSIEYIINSRTSVGRYDREKSLDRPVIEKLVRMATTAPSAFNLQNWRFIAVQSAGAKEQLRALSYGQKPVSDAAVTFIVCGQLEAHRQLYRNLQPAVDRGIITRDLQQTWTDMATNSHEGNPQLQRDEAIRSASLAAIPAEGNWPQKPRKPLTEVLDIR